MTYPRGEFESVLEGDLEVFQARLSAVLSIKPPGPVPRDDRLFDLAMVVCQSEIRLEPSSTFYVRGKITGKTMNFSLEGKTFLIAGGSTGIGNELARQLSESGANVHVFSRTQGELELGGPVTHHSCDFSTDDFESAELPETIHGAVYCPGTINLRSFRSLTLEDFRNDLEVNTIGAIKFLKGCLSGLKKGADQQPTSVVLFSTVAVGTGMPMHSSIAVAKGAIEGLTRSLAAELAPNVRVNCLAPALTDTPLAAKFFATEEKRAAMDAKYPLGRAGSPEDLASMAATLLSPNCGWVTGQIIGVDGGMSSIRN